MVDVATRRLNLIALVQERTHVRRTGPSQRDVTRARRRNRAGVQQETEASLADSSHRNVTIHCGDGPGVDLKTPKYSSVIRR